MSLTTVSFAPVALDNQHGFDARDIPFNGLFHDLEAVLSRISQAVSWMPLPIIIGDGRAGGKQIFKNSQSQSIVFRKDLDFYRNLCNHPQGSLGAGKDPVEIIAKEILGF